MSAAKEEGKIGVISSTLGKAGSNLKTDGLCQSTPNINQTKSSSELPLNNVFY